MSLGVRLWVLVLMLALTGYAGFSAWRRYEQSVQAGESRSSVKSLKDVAAATLTERSGQPLALKELEGKVWIGSFFFASCPGTCRQINTAIAGLQEEFKDKDVTLVSITVDPDNDTPAVLRDYAKSFNADPKRWLFLTGNFGVIKQVCQELFAMPIDKKVHTERLVLFDKAGHSRGYFATNQPTEMAALRRGVDELLAETPAEANPPKKVVIVGGDDS